ncbi:ATP-dependent DNA ligase [Streptomyces qinglanensis]|uniref:ATP-dependent DNA ligase n=1 Tax=Streptomyces qinglanensis TaxID=943816 RepID=A0A1E7K1R8_9ACTN|nr:non-homologous end-joining DNA ligase [Streptomyces qinglanensis]OEU97878.1 ATP-dependent DNA ligase [Streptomyces qinglanensis]OEV24474.1 ATP-dependent DNA ligase [Streptomyces nanshensis]
MPHTEIGGHRLALSNLDKVLYPATGFTKGEAIRYYAAVADVLLPHLDGRPLSFLRFPDGVEGEKFFTKHVPPGTPDWVTTRKITVVSRTPLNQVLIQDEATLVWAANLAALELHTPQWQSDHQAEADRLVFDLDPGEGADILDCRRLADWLRERVADDGIALLPKTSGSKGLHLIAAIERTPSDRVSAYAKRLAQQAEAELPDHAVSKMAKDLRPGKVFVDWSQNNQAKTTAAPYTLRAKQRPTASTPLTWAELAAADRPEDLVFLGTELPQRIEEYGDLLAPLLESAAGSGRGRIPA